MLRIIILWLLLCSTAGPSLANQVDMMGVVSTCRSNSTDNFKMYQPYGTQGLPYARRTPLHRIRGIHTQSQCIMITCHPTNWNSEASSFNARKSKRDRSDRYSISNKKYHRTDHTEHILITINVCPPKGSIAGSPVDIGRTS